jgi:hypothetical protein
MAGAYGSVRPVLNQIANTYPHTTDIRTPGARVEVMDVMWWPSNREDFAGDMLVWRGFETPPTTVPISLRYKRVCPLYRAVVGSGSPATYERSDELIFTDGVILRANSTDATIRNSMSFYNETLEVVGPEPSGAADEGFPVYGRAPTIRATATFPFTLGSFAFGGNVFRDPFNVFRDTSNILAGRPQVSPVVYEVRHATGPWTGATNIVVGYVGHTNGDPLQLMREVTVVRGLRE